jgi:seryl-tRNA synthetase
MMRDQPEEVRRRLASRGAGDELKVHEVLALDEQRRRMLGEVEALKAQRNRVSKEIGLLMGQKKLADAEARKTQTRQIGERIADLDKAVADTERARDELLLPLPNLPHASVPVGHSAEENLLVRTWSDQPTHAFKPKSHLELCESLKLVDFARGTKLSGSGFLLYTDWGARLERALIQFLLDLHTREHGYTEVSPPYIISRNCMEGVGQFPKFVDQAYGVCDGTTLIGLKSEFDKLLQLHDELAKLARSPEEKKTEQINRIGDAITVLGTYVKDTRLLNLLPTAEAPVANIHRDEILKESQLPIRYCAYSPCFRAEAGAAGVGSRGMIRVHQFDKVELIKIVKPEDGYAELEQMVANAERVLQLLGLHYRVVLLCTGDMGFASAKTYDLEVWAPGQGSYLEVSSCSNCEDFQARRMNLRYKTEAGENRLPHILNGSGTALARLFVALIETYQQADGSLVVPAPLQPYLKAERVPG